MGSFSSSHHQVDFDTKDVTVPAADDEVLKRAKPKQAPRPKALFLDGIRGAAAILVVSHHVGYLKGRITGGVAVHTFFVLSAFLLTMLLERTFQKLRDENAPLIRWAFALIDYIARRILRVYPLVTAVGVLLAFSSDQHKNQWYEFKHKFYEFSLWKLLAFDEGHFFYVFWTLPLELAYYLLIPVFVAVTTALRRWWWVPLFPLAGWVIKSGLYVYVTAGSDFRLHLPEFVAGSIGAVVYNRLDSWIRQTHFTFRLWYRVVIWILESLVVLLLFSVTFDALIFDPNWYGPYPFMVKGSDHFVCVHVVILIVCEMVSPGPISSVFEWSPLRYAGKVSFSIYLLHPRIIHSDFILQQQNYYTKCFAVWILVFFWSTVSYHLVEVPGQRLAAYVSKMIKALDAEEKAIAVEYAALAC